MLQIQPLKGKRYVSEILVVIGFIQIFMKSKLDEQIAKLFFSCNLAFNIADNFIFRETIDMLRPGYNPSNRKDISGPLLDQAYDKPLHK